MTTRPITYTLDARDTIIDIEGSWDAFARENQAPQLQIDTVLGRPIFEFFAGSETRSLYRQILDRARQTGNTVEIPFRCDAPDVMRRMQLSIVPVGGGRLRVRSTLLEQQPRIRVDFLDRRAQRSETTVLICSVCRRVAAPSNGWLEPDEAARRFGLFDTDRQPAISERICPSCEHIQAGCRYLVTLTNQAPEQPLPLVVFLHGGAQSSWLLRLHAPPRITEHNALNRDYALVSPVCPSGSSWHDVDLESILAEVMARYPIDPTRIYFTGISAGATAVWNWASTKPDRMAAVVPIAGMLSPNPNMGRFPVWIFHGRNDPVVPLPFISGLLSRLRQVNPRAQTMIYDDGGHDVWSRAYADDALWSWMFQQSAPPPAS
ncbi:MAG: hypothetical protein K0V04_02420 [Deltaproteobacteria bacterium]|nr:hypothetical protein [Deltaproteobacteria bacterium]